MSQNLQNVNRDRVLEEGILGRVNAQTGEHFDIQGLNHLLRNSYDVRYHEDIIQAIVSEATEGKVDYEWSSRSGAFNSYGEAYYYSRKLGKIIILSNDERFDYGSLDRIVVKAREYEREAREIEARIRGENVRL